jgi:hypothetical protein
MLINCVFIHIIDPISAADESAEAQSGLRHSRRVGLNRQDGAALRVQPGSFLEHAKA